MEFLRGQPARIAIGVAILIVLVVAIRRLLRWAATREDRDLEAAMRQALADGDLKTAGEIQVKRGNLVEASRIFRRGNEHALAAKILLELGDEKNAAEEFEKAKDHSRAGALYRKLGDTLRAGTNFEKCRDRTDKLAGAECLEDSEPLRAGRLYQDCEEFEKAADCFAKVEDLDSLDVALTMLENAALAKTTEPSKRKKLWARAGELALKLGAHDRAAKAFDEAGELAKAAEIYEKTLKKYSLAAAIYAERGDSAGLERNSQASGDPLGVLDARLVRARARGDRQLVETLESQVRQAGGNTAATVVVPSSQRDEATVLAPSSGERPVKPKPSEPARFEILGELGRGGMGVVHRGRDLRLGRFVALKFLPADVEPGSTMMRLFHREARAAAALAHPGIVTIYDSGTLDGREFIAMELVEGKTFDRVLDDEGPLPVAQALDVMDKVLQAIEYAHNKTVIHRDLKPANLMRTKTGIKVMDFGLAKNVNSNSSGGQTVVGGTPSYMPPEQKTGHTDHRADIFALGATFYELVTGVLPGRPGEPASVATNYPTLRDRTPSAPPRLSELVMRCLEHDRNDRPQDVVGMLTELREIRAEMDAEARRAERATERKTEKKRESPGPAPAAAAPAPKPAVQEPVKKRPVIARVAREDDDADVPKVERIDRVGPTRSRR